MSHSSGDVNFTSVSSHVPPQPEPPLTFFIVTAKSSVVPSGLLPVPLIVCVFPSAESVWVMEVRTLPSFLITIFQLLASTGVIATVFPNWVGCSVPAAVYVLVTLPDVHLYLLPPRSSILVCSPVNLLFSMFIFHFPMKGSSAAQSVLANKHASTSEEYKCFMVPLRRRIIDLSPANAIGKIPG